MKIQNLTENFDEEIENILIENGTITNEMVYEDHNIASIPFKNNDELKNFVENNCLLLEDETYFYILCKESELLKATGSGFNGEDYTVQRVLKRKYTFLGDN